MRNIVIINEDNSHFFGSRPADAMTMEGLHAFVDQYADTAVTHLFLCPNAMRASFRSETRDAIWDAVEGSAPEARWPTNAKLLHERGLDPYSVWITRAREKGISPWLSMRMNDIHSVNEDDNWMHSTFWRTHPEFWRVPHGKASPWFNRALNYAHQEVREHQMAFVRELLERYDPDGIELDWMRFGYHLTPGRAEEEAPILTAFVRNVRELIASEAAKRGHPIRLSVRVPAHPDAARGLGLDGVRWAQEGLVDMLVPCPFWTSSDFDIPVELWLERLGERAGKVVVAPGIEHNARPWPGAQPLANDLALLYGFAASARHRGADSIYLFNWMDSQTRPVAAERYRTLLEEGLGNNVVLHQPRRHPLCYRDTVPAGFPNNVRLPVDAAKGGQFDIPIGPAPDTGSAVVVLGLTGDAGEEAPGLSIQVNRETLTQVRVVEDGAGLGGEPALAVHADVPLGALRDGHNRLSVQASDTDTERRIVWVEIRINP